MNEFDHRILLFIHSNAHFKYKKNFCINIIQDVLCWNFIKFLDEVKNKKNVKAPVFQITVDFYNIEDKYFLEAEFWLVNKNIIKANDIGLFFFFFGKTARSES